VNEEASRDMTGKADGMNLVVQYVATVHQRHKIFLLN